MTIMIDVDNIEGNQPNLFPSDNADYGRVRMRPAEFARLMGCSKQAVSRWIQDGKIVLGADGRLQPNIAVTQLLRNSNLNQLRTKLLRPVIKHIDNLDQKIKSLEQQLDKASSDAEFYEGSTTELLNLLDQIEPALISEMAALEGHELPVVIHAFLSWLDGNLQAFDPDRKIIDFIPHGALEDVKKGEGNINVLTNEKARQVE